VDDFSTITPLDRAGAVGAIARDAAVQGIMEIWGHHTYLWGRKAEKASAEGLNALVELTLNVRLN